MRFRLRTLMIVLAALPPLLALTWWTVKAVSVIPWSVVFGFMPPLHYIAVPFGLALGGGFLVGWAVNATLNFIRKSPKRG
jgi:hypothetical protein